MKELKYTGVVTKFNNPPEPSMVILTELSSGTDKETTADSQKLKEKNIGQNDKFEIYIDTVNSRAVGELIKK